MANGQQALEDTALARGALVRAAVDVVVETSLVQALVEIVYVLRAGIKNHTW